ncbi:MAG: hypothetical protein ABF289_15165 [Clostridiales bacterium]
MYKCLLSVNEIDLSIYNSLTHIIIPVTLIACILGILRSLTQEKIRITSLLLQIIMSGIAILFVIKPLYFLDIGEVVFGYSMDLLNTVEVER